MRERSASVRSSGPRRRALARSQAIAVRLGAGLREARQATGQLQREAAAKAGLSQPRYSELERGLGAEATLTTWAVAAGAVGEQLVAFLEHVPGASRPRDYEHLRRQQLVVRVALGGGWRALPEMPIDPEAYRSRSVDVCLVRPDRREAAVVEIWDWFADIGASMRDLDAKIGAVTRQLDREAPMRVSGLWIVRGTRRNRQMVREFGDLFSAKFAARGAAWLTALEDSSAVMPQAAGLLWTDVAGTRLIEARVGR